MLVRAGFGAAAQHDVEAGLRRDLGDAGTHDPRADDADRA